MTLIVWPWKLVAGARAPDRAAGAAGRGASAAADFGALGWPELAAGAQARGTASASARVRSGIARAKIMIAFLTHHGGGARDAVPRPLQRSRRTGSRSPGQQARRRRPPTSSLPAWTGS